MLPDSASNQDSLTGNAIEYDIICMRVSPSWGERRDKWLAFQ